MKATAKSESPRYNISDRLLGCYPVFGKKGAINEPAAR